MTGNGVVGLFVCDAEKLVAGDQSPRVPGRAIAAHEAAFVDFHIVVHTQVD